MGRTDNGTIENLSTSGSLWSGYHAEEIRKMFFDLLRSAKTTIRISAFSMGPKNSDTEEFWEEFVTEEMATNPNYWKNYIYIDEKIYNYKTKKPIKIKINTV